MTLPDAEKLNELLRTRMGWRVGPHTAAYILAKMKARGVKSVPVLATDARTGAAVAGVVDLRELAGGQGTLF